jgi:hypothetical protein
MPCPVLLATWRSDLVPSTLQLCKPHLISINCEVEDVIRHMEVTRQQLARTQQFFVGCTCKGQEAIDIYVSQLVDALHTESSTITADDDPGCCCGSLLQRLVEFLQQQKQTFVRGSVWRALWRCCTRLDTLVQIALDMLCLMFVQHN